MKKTDLAYFAGLFDGEGSISLCAYKPKGRCIRTTYGLYISLAQTNEWIIQQLKFAFGGNIQPYQPKYPGARMVWAWRTQSNNALVFLESIYPYLRLKKPQADVAIKFQKHKLLRGGASRSQAYVDFEKELKDAISRLNKKRVRDGNSSRI